MKHSHSADGKNDDQDTATVFLTMPETLAAPAADSDASPVILTKGIPTDPLLNGGSAAEWQLNGTWGLHAEKVWTDYTGAGILVTDLDDGFQITHPDIAPNYRTDLDYDFEDNDADASAGAGDNHGTSVLGEIIGDDNGTGMVGVAFDAQGFGIRMGFGASGSLYQIQEGFQYALTKGADVMNNSWGFTSAYDDDFGAVTHDPTFAGTAAAVKALADTGRDGLGTAMVFAAGNDRTDGDNTNYHNFQNSPYIITVAAIDSTGTVAYFSNPGTSILVSAAGVNDVTTDRTGSAGYVSGDYVYFSGTSAAAPIVSGLIALMLQANSTLGWRDVEQILAYSAQHNDPNAASWQYNGAENWNGGGLHYSSDYGFGAADAFTAIRLAETWNTQQDSANMLTVSGGSMTTATAIHGSTAVDSTIAVAANINVEHVLINLNITDTDLSHLVVTLRAPDGTTSVLVNDPANGTSSTGIAFQATTVADWGETSAGTWTLDVKDSSGSSSGTLASWSLTFLGSAISPSNTYFYTDDFAGFSGAALSARSTISDGGTADTLNLACVTSGSTVDLDTGTALICGHTVTIAGGTNIATVFGGDGNDVLTGNGGDNHLYGERGNDTLIGGGGNDFIDGGAGVNHVVYDEDLANFTFALASSTQLTITDTLGTLGVDTVQNVTTFSFLYATMSWAQLVSLSGAPSGGGSSGGGGGGGGGNGDTGNVSVTPTTSYDSISAIIPVGKHSSTFTTDSDSTQTLTAAQLGSKGATSWLEIQRDSSGLTLDYLNSKATHTVALTGGDDGDTITIMGAAVPLIATVTTGAGDDTIHFNIATTATVHAGDGNDVLDGSNGRNVFYGEGGNDTLVGGNAADTLSGGDGDDEIHGGAGNDVIHGDAGNNALYGDAGNDTLVALAGNNVVHGGDGNDIMTAGDGNNLFYGDAGNDKLTVGNGANELHGGDGNDSIHAGGGANIIFGDAGNDSIVAGGGGNQIDGGAGNNTITSGAGDDTIQAGTGNNFVYAGGGADVVHGGGANDILYGQDGDDTLYAGLGKNTLSGGNGDDTLYSMGGTDTLYGGAGADTFVFTAIAHAPAMIMDFNAAAGDKVDLSALLENYDSTSMAIADFVKVTTSGKNTVISVDETANTDGGNHYVAVATLYHVTHLDLPTLVNEGAIAA